ncbi:MAG: malate dehydrogenase, partial [Candidatus Thioglobus sp.]|nr:malate dehydrogenase [Candidatus Thioglobus sp.]
MSKEFHKLALDYHQGKKPGKIFVSSHKSLETHEDLSLAYTPGVAA